MDREKFRLKLEKARQWPIPKDPKLQKMYNVGLIKMAHLQDEGYYMGLSEHSIIGMWDKEQKLFWCMRRNFGTVYADAFLSIEELLEKNVDKSSLVFLPYYQISN